MAQASGYSRAPQPLPGSIATVRQGNLVPGAGGWQAIGPAWRMICALDEDCLHTAPAGGIDDSPHSGSPGAYARWADAETARGGMVAYHTLAPPQLNEAPAAWT